MRGTKSFSFDEIVFHRIEDLATESGGNQTALIARLINREWERTHPTPLVAVLPETIQEPATETANN